MSGTDETNTAAFGRPFFSVVNAWSSWLRYVVTGVIVDSDDVHASFAPMRIVTYCTPRLTAVCAWPSRSTILAPERASLKLWPLIAAFFARMRR